MLTISFLCTGCFLIVTHTLQTGERRIQNESNQRHLHTHTRTHTPIIAGAAEAPELSTVELLLTTTTTMPTTTIALVETARTGCSSETPAQIVFAVPQTNGEYNVFRREMRWKSNTPTNANTNAITAQSAGTFIRLAGIAFESELNSCNEKRFMPRKWRTNCNRHTYASTHTHTHHPPCAALFHLRAPAKRRSQRSDTDIVGVFPMG